MKSALLTVLVLNVAQTSEDPTRLSVVAPNAPITIGVGETVMVNLRVPVRRPPVVAVPHASAVSARPRAARGRGVAVAPWGEVRGVGKRAARVWVPITGTAPGKTKLTIAVELRERGAEDPVALPRFTMEVTVVDKPRTEQNVDAAMAAYDREQAIAKAAYAKLQALHDDLRLDRFDRAPAQKRVQDRDVVTLNKYLAARFRAHAAQRYLRFAADDPDPEVAFAATRGIGKLTASPTGDLATARTIEGVSNAKAIALTRAAIEDLRVDEAEGFAIKLLASGRLDPLELAQMLVLRGFIEVVRSAPKTATRSLGQALCLDREVDVKPSRTLFVEAFQKAKTENTCDTPIAVKEVTAERIGTDTGKNIRIIATFGPDPHRLIEKANVQLWGYGGSVETAVTVAALHAGGHRIEAQLSDSEDHDERILLKVFLQDAHNIEVAAIGDPDPLSVPLVIGDGGGAGVPWWVWAIAGGVVVAGAATAGIVALSSSGEVRRVLGPVDVRF